MQQLDDRTEHAEQKKVARRYRRLGYDVHENPGPDRLPDFMRGARVDLVARSPSDNVVVEIKRHASLKGSNELVDVAERVSDHPDWRFELVVLADPPDQVNASKVFKEHLARMRAAVDSQSFDPALLLDMGFLYLANMLVHAVRDVAAKAGVAIRGKSDRTLLQDLAFKGVLPGGVVEQCLTVLTMRDNLAGTYASRSDLDGLLVLCQDVRAFL